MKQLFAFNSLLKPLAATFVLAALVFSGCSKDEIDQQEDTTLKNTRDIPFSTASSLNDMAKVDYFRQLYAYLGPKTQSELIGARTSTAMYRDINFAMEDGYKDINIVMPNMGYHYMKASLLDDKFDANRPEILVYNKDKDGRATLVAVEYAIPLDQSKEAPEGFTGDYDLWTANTELGLWLLHAWVWYYNPDGIFASKNPNIILP